MVNKDISPEERLFNIIKTGKPYAAGSGANEKQPVRKRPSDFGVFRCILSDRLKRLFGVLAGFLGGNRKPAHAGAAAAHTAAKVCVSLRNLDIAAVARMLALTLAVCVSLVIYAVFHKGGDVKQIADKASDIKIQMIKQEDIEPLKPLSVYIEEAESRDIFGPVAKKTEGPEAAVVKTGLRDLTKNLSLVGIYMGMSPEAMIEDMSEEKTYFLKRGSQIKGIKIKEILPDRVILEYNGDEMEFM